MAREEDLYSALEQLCDWIENDTLALYKQFKKLDDHDIKGLREKLEAARAVLEAE